jgi:hypothetical protein
VAKICLTDKVDCIHQQLQDWEAIVPFFFSGQAQG